MNGYYSGSGDNITPFTAARAEAVAAEFDAVSDGFDLLPDSDVIREGRIGYLIDTGAANALIGTFTGIAPTALKAGLTVRIKVVADNTGPATLNVNALGAKPILLSDGVTALVGGEMIANSVVLLLFDGDNFRALAGGRLVEKVRDQAIAAAASALLAPGTQANSTTTQTIETGNKTFLIERGKLFTPGQTMVAATVADPTQQMTGVVVSHNPTFSASNGQITIFVTSIAGTGSFSAWRLALSASSTSTTAYGKVTGGGLATGGGPVSMDQTITVPAAALADVITGTSTTKAVTPKPMRDASRFVAVPYAANVVLNGLNGINFKIGALTGDLALGDPVNLHEGESFSILVPQDASGGRAISFSSAWVPDNGRTFTLSSTASALDIIDVQVVSLSPLRLRYAISKGSYA